MGTKSSSLNLVVLQSGGEKGGLAAGLHRVGDLLRFKKGEDHGEN